MKFHVLGNPEVWSGTRELSPFRPRQERFLARLLLTPNTLVPIGSLAEALWDDGPPASAERQVQNTASQLRQAWLKAGVTEARDILRTARAGYVLHVDLEQIDLYLFRGQVATAAKLAAAGEARAAVDALRQALALWRSGAFAGVDSRVVREHALLIDEERPVAWEECMRLELQAGRHSQVVSELATLVAEYPFRERLVGQLMTALYRSGRQADALHVYRKARGLLDDELGIDPGPELRELHGRVLRNDPTLLGPAPTTPPTTAAPRPAVPSQVPPPDGRFTGRRTEMDLLTRHCGQAQVVVVTGAGGMGKTSLVAQWAHQVRDEFPDGQVFVDLRGHSAAVSYSPSAVLTHLLESLNVAPQQVPAQFDKMVALYRSLVADKKLLIVLDNAGSPDQVLPAVPATGGAHLVVTSRAPMTALFTRVAVERLPLDGLDRAEGRAILADAVGDAVGDAHAAASPSVERLLDLCGGMPLALRILAARIRSEPHRTVVDLVEELSRHRALLDGFTIEGDTRSVRSVLASSYAALPAEDARFFRLLAVHPGKRVRIEAAAVVAGVSLTTASRCARVLSSLHLVAETGAGGLVTHDLVRSFAEECLDETAEADGRDEAVGRFVDWYVSVAAMAGAVLRPDRDAFAGRAQAVDPLVEPFGEDVDAITFLNEERGNLAPATVVAVRHDADRAVELIYHLHSYFVRSGFATEDVAAWRLCEENVHRVRSPLMRAHLYHALGGALAVTHDLDAAPSRLYRSAELYEQEGEPAGAAGARLGVGWVMEVQGRYKDALVEYEHALTLARAAGNTTLVAHALNNSADALIALDEIDAALTRLTTALELTRDAGLRHHQAAILSSIGELHLRSGDHARALDHLHEGLALMRRSGFRTAEADTLSRIGRAVLASGRPDEAAPWFRRAQDVYRQNNDVAGEAAMIRLLAELAGERAR